MSVIMTIYLRLEKEERQYTVNFLAIANRHCSFITDIVPNDLAVYK